MHNRSKDKVISVEIMTEKGRVFGVTRRELPDSLKEKFDELMDKVIFFKKEISPSRIRSKF